MLAAAILSLRLSDEIANLRGGGELDGTSEHDKSDEDGQKSATSEDDEHQEEANKMNEEEQQQQMDTEEQQAEQQMDTEEQQAEQQKDTEEQQAEQQKDTELKDCLAKAKEAPKKKTHGKSTLSLESRKKIQAAIKGVYT